MTKTFEEEIFCVMDKFLKDEKLTLSDLLSYSEICKLYEKKVKALNLTKMLRTYCKNKFNLNLENNKNKVAISFYESLQNNENAKEKYEKMIVEFPKLKITLIYDMNIDHYDNLLVHNFFVDGNLILKKYHNNKKKNSINLSYLNEIINDNKLQFSTSQFLDSFLNLFDLIDTFEDVLLLIENNEQKYLNKASSSDSDSDIGPVSDENDD